MPKPKAGKIPTGKKPLKLCVKLKKKQRNRSSTQKSDCWRSQLGRTSSNGKFYKLFPSKTCTCNISKPDQLLKVPAGKKFLNWTLHSICHWQTHIELGHCQSFAVRFFTVRSWDVEKTVFCNLCLKLYNKQIVPAKVWKRFALPQKVEITVGVCHSTGAQNPELAEKKGWSWIWVWKPHDLEEPNLILATQRPMIYLWPYLRPRVQWCTWDLACDPQPNDVLEPPLVTQSPMMYLNPHLWPRAQWCTWDPTCDPQHPTARWCTWAPTFGPGFNDVLEPLLVAQLSMMNLRPYLWPSFQW